MVRLDSLRDDAYTGSNRCWPCTLLNLTLVAVAVLYVRLRGRPLLSGVVATVGVAAIYLRGYLVPYTPAFAPQLIAASPLPDDLFHDATEAPDERVSLASEVELDGETVFETLLEAGALDASDEMIVPSDDVETEWTERMDDLASRSLADLGSEIASSLDTVDETEPAEIDGREWIVLGSDSDRLVARPVAVAELAAYDTLGEYVDDDRLRLAAAETFLMFLDTCPVCSTPLVESTEVSCCGGHTTPRENPRETLVCRDCDQRVYTFPAE